MKKQKITIRIAVIFITITLLSSCTTSKPLTWSYETNDYRSQEQLSNKNVSVIPFQDSRVGNNEGSIYTGYIPVVPFGWQTQNKPEAAKNHYYTTDWKFDPSKDFAKALETELTKANIFNKATYKESKPEESDLILTGEIIQTKYKSKMFTYGASVLSGFLWYVGAPSNSWRNELELKIICKDPKTGQVVFEKKYYRDYRSVKWIYTTGGSDFEFDYLLKQVYEEFIQDLKNSRAI